MGDQERGQQNDAAALEARNDAWRCDRDGGLNHDRGQRRADRKTGIDRIDRSNRPEDAGVEPGRREEPQQQQQRERTDSAETGSEQCLANGRHALRR